MKNKTILLLATTTGDSNAINEFAQAYDKTEEYTVTVASLGPLAHKKLQYLSDHHSIRYIHVPMMAPLCITDLQMEGQLPIELPEEAIAQLGKDLGEFDLVLSGTPSPNSDGHVSLVAFQLLAHYQDRSVTGAYNDYLFEDESHPFYLQMNKINPNHIFMYSDSPFANSPLLKNVTALRSHPALDNAKKNFQACDSATLNQTRQKIDVTAEETLIFVPGGKSSDLPLIQDIAKALQAIKTFEPYKIRIGLHPAASEQYRQELEDEIETLGMSTHIALIKPGILKNNGEAMLAADAVIGKESTMVAEAFAMGKPSTYTGQRNFFAAPVTEPKQLAAFIQNIPPCTNASTSETIPTDEISCTATTIISHFK